MERDFMGLNAKDSAVKEEVVEGCEDSGFVRSSGVPWPSSNKVSTLPQFMTLRCKEEEKPSMNGQPVYPMHRFSAKQQFHGGNTHTGPHPTLPTAASIAGPTEQWTSKASNAPAQLTIFYGGAVNVFDGISPEKAQAIMILAGNMYAQSMMNQSKHHMQLPASKVPAGEQPLVNQPMNTAPSSRHPSPMSVSSHPIDQSSTNNNDIKVSKTAAESPRVMSSMGSVAASAIMSSAVPQARKASLARFLEKRKERVMCAAAPYKKGGDCKTTESNDFGFSTTSGICHQ